MSWVRSSMAVAAATGTIITGMSAAAHAVAPSPSPGTAAGRSHFASDNGRDLQKKIDYYLAEHGGKQRGKNQVVWDDEGVIVTFPAPADAKDDRSYARPAPCGDGNFCLWEHAWWDRNGGLGVAYYRYGWHDLRDKDWSDRVSSWENNQTKNADGRAYNISGPGLLYVFGERAYSYAEYVGDANNDKADWLFLSR